MNYKNLSNAAKIGLCRYSKRENGFDESKIKRDSDGQFASTGGSKKQEKKGRRKGSDAPKKEAKKEKTPEQLKKEDDHKKYLYKIAEAEQKARESKRIERDKEYAERRKRLFGY